MATRPTLMDAPTCAQLATTLEFAGGHRWFQNPCTTGRLIFPFLVTSTGIIQTVIDNVVLTALPACRAAHSVRLSRCGLGGAGDPFGEDEIGNLRDPEGIAAIAAPPHR